MPAHCCWTGLFQGDGVDRLTLLRDCCAVLAPVPTSALVLPVPRVIFEIIILFLPTTVFNLTA